MQKGKKMRHPAQAGQNGERKMWEETTLKDNPRIDDITSGNA
jgi:hypothetical protein